MAARTVTRDRPMFRFSAFLPNPPTFWGELSTDGRLASINLAVSRPFGADYTAWDAAGPVVEYWNDEVLPFTEEICRRDKSEIFRDVDWEGKFSLLLFMIGRTQVDAKPTLVVRISDLKVMGRLASRLLKEQRFKRTGFAVKGQQGGLRYVWGEDVMSAKISQSFSANQVERSLQTLFGETVLMVPDNEIDAAAESKHERYATMGAVVRIGSRVFGLTAAHALADRIPPRADSGDHVDVDRPDALEIYDEKLFELFTDNDDPDLSSFDSATPESSEKFIYNFDVPHSIYVADPNRIPNITDLAATERLVPRRGVHIGEYPGWHPKLLPAEQYANPDMDWALISLQDQRRLTLSNRIQAKNLDISTVAISNQKPVGDVVVVSKITEYRRSYCSGALALISLPASEGLRRVYPISCFPPSADSASPEAQCQGESGSLVVDAGSGDAHGMVVAASRDLHLSYMLPIQDIFVDISKSWSGSLISFPTDTSSTTYSPVANKMIRLFVLEPGSPADPIRGSIAVAHPETVQYDFLSYSWETNQMTEPITLDGRQILVPKSLEAGLRHLRHTDRHRTIWADAICINMRDAVERTHINSQWPLLASNAANVCIWLGEEEKNSRRAFDLMDLMSRAEVNTTLAELSEDLLAFKDLLKRPWFSRRWVVPEIAYARAASIHLASFQTDWATFADCVVLIATLPTSELQEFARLPATQLIYLCERLFRKSDNGQALEALLPLSSIVCALTNFKNGDPRDTIYACLALAKGTGLFVSSGPELAPRAEPSLEQFNEASLSHQETFIKQTLISGRGVLHPRQRRNMLAWWVWTKLQLLLLAKGARGKSLRRNSHALKYRKATSTVYRINYADSFAEVAMDFMTFTFSKTRSVDIVCRAWAPKTEAKGLPTWIRSLEHAEFEFDLDGEPRRVNAEPLTHLQGLEMPRYKAGGKLESEPFILNDTLHVTGYVVETIEHLYMPAILGNIPFEWLETGQWERSHDMIPPRLWRTLVADRDSAGRLPPPWYSRACRGGFMQGVEGRDIDVGKLTNREGSSEQPPMVQEFFRRVQRVIWSRRLMKVSSGTLGLAPRTSKVGDLICVFEGCSVPVVLRENPGSLPETFQIVGECFVLGIMDGEALEKGLTKHTFALK